jgi:hypothetical protein
MEVTDQLHALAVLFRRKKSPLLIDWRLNDPRNVWKLRIRNISSLSSESNQHSWDISPLVHSLTDHSIQHTLQGEKVITGVYICVRRVSPHLTRLYRLPCRKKPAVEVAPIKKRHCGQGTEPAAGCLSSWADHNNASALSHVQIWSITRRWGIGC